MKVLGIRNSVKQFRYAVLCWDGENTLLLNADTENLIKMPANIKETTQQLYWLYQEIDRIIRQNSGISCIAIKPNEYGRGETSSSRLAAYFDGIVYLVAGQHNLPVTSKLYRQIGTKRDDVLKFSEDNIRKTQSNWNQQMADAVAVAWSSIEK